MLSTAYYFLQVIFCSAVMMGYYWLVLRNKKFHQYNRFYLLGILVLSWIIPIIKIQWNKPVAGEGQVINFLSFVADSNTEIEANISNKGFQISWEGAAVALYIAVATILFSAFIYGLARLYFLLKENSCKNMGDIYLVLTKVNGTPFSFFRYIFWHESIDLRTGAGKQMLEHELTHVQQKHSIDKVLIQLVLVAGWYNPFFWLLKNEMEMIHEFIADKKAVNNGGTASLAQMLLTAAYPQQQYLLTHPFFFSPIKRRLQMITNNKNPRFSYLRRLVILPLLAVVVVLFAFRSKEANRAATISVGSLVENVFNKVTGNKTNSSFAGLSGAVVLNKTYTVVIDAGHGGQDKGAIGLDGSTESNISLQLAKAVRDINQNDQIKILLTRDGDVSQSVTEKAKYANDQHADLFISLHCNSAAPVNHTDGNTTENPDKGIEIFIANKEKAVNYEANLLLANHLATAVKDLNDPFLGVKSNRAGIWVLQSVNCPSALIEAGFMSNKTDLEKLEDAKYQKSFAAGILNGIQEFLVTKEQGNPVKDTTIRNGKDSVSVSIKTAASAGEEGGHLIILDGVRQPMGALKNINHDNIESIRVLKDKFSTDMYGDEGKNGVIVINTKKRNSTGGSENIVPLVTTGAIPKKAIYILDDKRVDTLDVNKVDPKTIESINVFKGEDAMFLYGQDAAGGVVKITTKKNTVLGTETNDKLFIQAEVPPSFPGGLPAWTKYLEQNLNRDIVVEKGGPPGKYTVVVAFKVDTEGNISEVKAENDPGYGTKDEAIRMIKKSPKWLPAVQNKQNITSIHRQSITWNVSVENDKDSKMRKQSVNH